MAYESLSEFLHELEDAADLARVSAVVEPSLELAEIVRQVASVEGGGPALLFEQVRGSATPVVANLFGTERRVCRALGLDLLEDLTRRVAALLQPDLPDGWLETVKLVPRIAERAKLPPKIVRAGACQQVVRMGRDVDLSELPVPRCWPQESGPVITAGQVVSQRRPDAPRNVETIPLEVRGRQTLALHWNLHHAARRTFVAAHGDGRPMPVAIVLGGDPAHLVAACAPFPHDADASLLAAFLRGSNVELVKCRSHDLLVPADADLVIEGVVDPTAPPELCGPIALPTGFYGPREERPLVHVSAITHRANPLFPAIVPRRAPSEHHWLGEAGDRMLLPAVQRFLPEVVDLHRPASGSEGIAFVSIRKDRPQQARTVLNAVWGLHGLSLTKVVVVVDEGVDVRREEDVWFQVAANVDPGRDVVTCEGATHPHDHASPLPGSGHKLGLDATRKLPDEGRRRAWPDELATRPELAQQVRLRWREYGLPEGLR